MTITFDISEEIAEQLRAEGVDIPRAAREAFLLCLYREGRISHARLGDALDLDRFETEAFLKSRQVFEGTLTHEEVEADVKSLHELIGKQAPE